MTKTEFLQVCIPIIATVLGWLFLQIVKGYKHKILERKRLIKTVLKLQQDVSGLQIDNEELKADIKEIISILIKRKDT
jgi:hypothetical protein